MHVKMTRIYLLLPFASCLYISISLYRIKRIKKVRYKRMSTAIHSYQEATNDDSFRLVFYLSCLIELAARYALYLPFVTAN